jgi:hypothetical protein
MPFSTYRIFLFDISLFVRIFVFPSEISWSAFDETRLLVRHIEDEMRTSGWLNEFPSSQWTGRRPSARPPKPGVAPGGWFESQIKAEYVTIPRRLDPSLARILSLSY